MWSIFSCPTYFKTPAQRLREFATQGLTDLVKEIINGGIATVEVIESRNEKGQNALILASSNGHLATVIALQSHYASYINLQDEDGLSALMHGCMKGDVYVVDTLLKCANIDVNLPDKNGYTAIMHAVAAGRIEVVETLLTCSTLRVNRNRAVLNMTRSNTLRTVLQERMQIEDTADRLALTDATTLAAAAAQRESDLLRQENMQLRAQILQQHAESAWVATKSGYASMVTTGYNSNFASPPPEEEDEEETGSGVVGVGGSKVGSGGVGGSDGTDVGSSGVGGGSVGSGGGGAGSGVEAQFVLKMAGTDAATTVAVVTTSDATVANDTTNATGSATDITTDSAATNTGSTTTAVAVHPDNTNQIELTTLHTTTAATLAPPVVSIPPPVPPPLVVPPPVPVPVQAVDSTEDNTNPDPLHESSLSGEPDYVRVVIPPPHDG